MRRNLLKIKALKLSTIAITSVFFVEVTVGLLSGSLAILSDGMHALFDALTVFILLVTAKISLKPPDEKHMYGHEKVEFIGGLIGGLSLFSIAFFIIYDAVSRLLGGLNPLNEEFVLAGFLSIAYTMSIDLFRIGCFSFMKGDESPTVKASVYHAVADFSSTIIALIGFWLANTGLYLCDPIAAIILGGALCFLSLKLSYQCALELSDIAPREIVDTIKSELEKSDKILAYEKFKVRKSGDKYYVEATLKFPEQTSLEEAHEMATEIETKIKNLCENAEVTLHIEPSES